MQGGRLWVLPFLLCISKLGNVFYMSVGFGIDSLVFGCCYPIGSLTDFTKLNTSDFEIPAAGRRC